MRPRPADAGPPFREWWVAPAASARDSVEGRADGIPLRHVVARGAREKHGAFLDRLARGSLEGDPLADEVVRAYSPARSVELFQHLGRGLSSGRVPTGAPRALDAFIDACFSPPSGVDWEAVDEGARVLSRSGVYGLLVLMNASLPLAYTSPGGVKPLVRTGDLLRVTGRRLFETLKFVVETAAPGGLRPGTHAWEITCRVRVIHAAVRARCLAAGDWRSDLWGTPVNQSDMLGTSLAFSTTFLEGMRRLGFEYTPAEAESLIALWRVSGHWTGVADDLLPTTEAEGRARAAAILATQAPPDDDSVTLVRALMRVPIFPWSRETYGPLTAFYYALSRGLIGDFYADALRYPQLDPRPVLTLYRGAAKWSDARRSLLGKAAFSSALGHQSWKVALAIGLGGRPAVFAR